MSEEAFVITPLRDRTDLTERAVEWFHGKWGIPKAAYRESIAACQREPKGVVQWYLVHSGEEQIIGGLGVIENDFHKRKDLTPNVCAVYVEEPFRGKGIARTMLDYVCRDMEDLGVKRLYLITGHTEFYEKCGWTFFCMVEEDDGNMARMYCHV